jgi:hypothetical protein
MKTKHTLGLMLIGLALSVFLVLPAQANLMPPIGPTTISAPGDFTGVLDYGNLQLTYEVTQNGLVHYKYTFYDPDGFDSANLSHIIFQVSDDFTDNDITNIAYPGYDSSTFEGGLGDYTEANGNPGLPASVTFFGYKFEPLDDDFEGTTFMVEFDSTRLPVEGHFYVIDGGGTGADAVYAHNYGSGDLLIPVPDTTVVPIPGSAFLLGGGLLGLAMLGFRRKRKG